MKDTTLKLIRNLLMLIVFIVALILVIVGQKNVGPEGLGVMLIGLAALVGLLWYYNRQYR